MKLPNPEQAVIEPTKLIQYLLNTEHRRGGHKARVLLDFGYHVDSWQQLQADIRRFHLLAEVEVVRQLYMEHVTRFAPHYRRPVVEC